MKTKTFGKKLSLNKKTIVDLNLNNGEMKNAHGGIDCTLHRTNCYLCFTYTCCTCGPTGNPNCPCNSQ